MSVEAMVWAFAQPIPPAPKVVLLALANSANEVGVCWPGLALVVERAKPMQLRTVQNHIRWLEQAGLIVRNVQFAESGRQTSNLYELKMATTYEGEGAESCMGEGAESCMGEGAESCMGEGASSLQGEGARAVAPSDKNLELSLETKKEGENAPNQPGVLCIKPGRARTGQPRGHRATPFPVDWSAEPWMRELAAGFGLSAEKEFVEFRNHHLAKGSRFVSWPHAFRTWVSRSVKFQELRRA